MTPPRSRREPHLVGEHETAPRQVEPYFTPTTEWQDVPRDAILPPGLEIRMSISTGVNQARLRPRPPTPPTPRSTPWLGLAIAAIATAWLVALAALVALT